jgi:hypothetical protein
MESFEQIITMLAQNTFVRAIVLPTILTLCTAVLEYQIKIVKGKGDGRYRYIAWVREATEDGGMRLVPYPHQSLAKIFNHNRFFRNLVDVQPMFTFQIAEFGSLAVNLAIGALAVDIVSLFDVANRQSDTAMIIVFHILMLVVIELMLIQSQITSPERIIARELQSLAAIIFGFSAMALAFFAV